MSPRSNQCDFRILICKIVRRKTRSLTKHPILRIYILYDSKPYKTVGLQNRRFYIYKIEDFTEKLNGYISLKNKTWQFPHKFAHDTSLYQGYDLSILVITYCLKKQVSSIRRSTFLYYSVTFGRQVSVTFGRQVKVQLMF